MSLRRLGALGAILSCTACGSSPDAAAPDGADPLPTTASSPVASAPASSGPAGPAPNVPTNLALLDQGPGRLSLFTIGETVIAIADVDEGTEAKPRSATRMGEVIGGKIAWKSELVLPNYSQGVKDINGTFPDKLLLTYVFDYGRGADQVIFTTAKTGWIAKEKKSNYHDFFYDAATLPDGSIVALTYAASTRDGRLLVPHGLAKAPLLPKDARCGEGGVYPSAVGVTPKGTLVAVAVCGEKFFGLTWAPGQVEGTLAPIDIPTMAGRMTVASMAIGSGDSAWAIVDEQLVHYKDGRWGAGEQGPDTRKDSGHFVGITGGAEDDTGGLWLYREWTDKLWRRRAAGAAWELVPIPPKVEVTSVVTQKGKVLVTAENFLLGQGDAGVDWSKVKVDSKEKTRVTRALPGSPACGSNVVVLYGFTKVTPDDYDFPLTRKALKGQRQFADVKFAVTREAGQKYFVALTSDFKKARALAEVIKKGVEGSSPQVVCAEPEVVRELPIDLATGEVKKTP